MSKYCEFHFQEGFTGENVTLSVDGETRVRFDARTRLQTGLSQIESLNLDPGQTVTIAVPSIPILVEYQVVEGDRWVTINMVDRALVVRPAQRRPGYL